MDTVEPTGLPEMTMSPAAPSELPATMTSTSAPTDAPNEIPALNSATGYVSATWALVSVAVSLWIVV